jgi:hypothetical protein
MAMGNSLYPVADNIFMEHFEEIAFETADHKPAKWNQIRSVLKYKQDGVLDINRTMDNVQKHNTRVCKR